MRPVSFPGSRRRARHAAGGIAPACAAVVGGVAPRCERVAGGSAAACAAVVVGVAVASRGRRKFAHFRLFDPGGDDFRRTCGDAFGGRSGAPRAGSARVHRDRAMRDANDAIAFSFGKNAIFFFRHGARAAIAHRMPCRRVAQVPSGPPPPPEFFLAKWLTSQKCVISFRPTLNCCGKESSRNDRQLAPPR
jgi:hypothetical protein